MRQREEGRAHLVAFTLDLEPLGFLYESREPVLIQQPASASRRSIDRIQKSNLPWSGNPKTNLPLTYRDPSWA